MEALPCRCLAPLPLAASLHFSSPRLLSPRFPRGYCRLLRGLRPCLSLGSPPCSSPTSKPPNRPLDEVDAAARILDPILGVLNGGEHVYGKFLKDYRPIEW